jgi:hypothetical protein
MVCGLWHRAFWYIGFDITSPTARNILETLFGEVVWLEIYCRLSLCSVVSGRDYREED